MGNEVKYYVVVDSSGAQSGVKKATAELRGADKAMKGLQQEAKKVSKAKAEMGKQAATTGNQVSQVFKAAGVDVGRFGGVMGTAAGTVSRVTASVRTLTASTNAFRVALMATGIGAVIVALGTLVQAFRSTQEGTDRLNRILVPLKSVFEAIWGVVQNLSVALVDRLVQAFRDPQQAIRDFGQAIFNNVQVRVQSSIEALGALGRVVTSVLTGNFRQAGEEARNFGRAMLDAATGIENTADRMAGFGREIAETSRIAFEAGREIQRLTEQIEQMQIDQVVPLARMRREYQELRTIAGDTLRSEEERLEAIEQAEVVLRQRAAMQKDLLDLEIERLELQQSFNDTSREEERQLQELIARREELEATTLRDLRSFERRRTSILRGIQEREEAERQQRMVFLMGLEERAEGFRDMLRSEEEMLMRSHEQQLASLSELLENNILTYEEYLDLRFELEAQLNEQLLELTNNRIEAEEELEEQKIQNMKEQYTILAGELAGLFTQVFGQSKAIAIAQAIIDAYAAYNRTIAQGGGFAMPLAALTLARGFAQVSNMRSIQPEGFQTGGLVGGGRRLIEVNESGRPEFVMNDRSTSAALPALEAMNQSPDLARSISRMVTGFQTGGATGSVRLDSSEFQRDFANMAESIKNVQVTLSAFDVTEKVGDQQSINRRRISVTD